MTKAPYIYSAKVLAVHDGDTITVDIDLGFIIHWTVNIRLLGINAPELGTVNGVTARDALSRLILGTQVVIQTIKDRPDKYGGRYDATVWLNDLNVNQWMIDQGYAAPYLKEIDVLPKRPRRNSDQRTKTRNQKKGEKPR